MLIELKMMKDLNFFKALYKNNNNIINLTTNSLSQIYTMSFQTIFILDQFSPILRNRKKSMQKEKQQKKRKKKIQALFRQNIFICAIYRVALSLTFKKVLIDRYWAPVPLSLHFFKQWRENCQLFFVLSR